MPSLNSWSDNCLVLGGFAEYGYHTAYLRDGYRVFPPQKNLRKCPRCGCETPTVEKNDQPHGRYHVWCWKCGNGTRPQFARRNAVEAWNKGDFREP